MVCPSIKILWFSVSLFQCIEETINFISIEIFNTHCVLDSYLILEPTIGIRAIVRYYILCKSLGHFVRSIEDEGSKL